MAIGKQGGHAAAPVSKPIVGQKPGGKVQGGGAVKQGITPAGKPGNNTKVK